MNQHHAYETAMHTEGWAAIIILNNYLYFLFCYKVSKYNNVTKPFNRPEETYTRQRGWHREGGGGMFNFVTSIV